MFRSSFYLWFRNPTSFNTCVLAPISVPPCYVQLVSLETNGNPTHLIDVNNFSVRWNAALIALSYILCYTCLNGICFPLEYCNGLPKTEANWQILGFIVLWFVSYNTYVTGSSYRDWLLKLHQSFLLRDLQPCFLYGWTWIHFNVC